MARPKAYRRIGKKPEHHCLNPNHKVAYEEIENEKNISNKEIITMNLDEFEAIRLGDYHKLKQKQSAELMGISQPTFHRILNAARGKVAKSLIEGIEIEIDNDTVIKEDNIYLCENCGFQWNNPKKIYNSCPDCKSTNIKIINLKEENENILINLHNIKEINCKNNEEENPLNTRKSFGGPGSGKGPSVSCICPNCGNKSPKIKGLPCKNQKCPECGYPLCGIKKVSKSD